MMNQLTMLNQANMILIILYIVSHNSTTFLAALCPERMICPTWVIAYVAAKNEPFNHRRRWLMNSGRESGTSVSPTAPLTYLRILRGKKKQASIYQIGSYNLSPVCTNSTELLPQVQNRECAIYWVEVINNLRSEMLR